MAAETTSRAANRRSRAAIALLLAGGVWALAAPAAAQELGLDIVVGRTDLPQLKTPIGLGLRALAQPTSFFGLEAGYTHVLSWSSFDGATCGAGVIPNCTLQRVESSTAVGTVSVTMLLGVAAGAFRFHVGAGLSHSVVWKAELRGVETSETVNAYIRADKILDFFGRPNGIQFMAAVDRPVELGDLPLRARLAYVRREVDWYECWAGPGARLHCVTTDWQQLAIGLTYPLGGGRGR